MRVDIWSDVVCPWCYVGRARFEQALTAHPRRDETQVVYHSFELDPGFPKGGGGTNLQLLSQKYGLTPEQARQADGKVAALARAEGLGYETERPVGNTFDIHRVSHLGLAQGVQPALVSAVNQAYFARAEPVFDPAVLAGIATGAGLDRAAVEQVLAGDDYAAAVRQDEAQAGRLGISGVPFYMLDMKLGVSGAQPAELFTQALDQAWEGARA